jgi:hypothetical protein
MSSGTMRAAAVAEPPPAVEPLENAAAVHEAIADRRAPAKTVLAVSP